ncbi:putative reverse transcriptase domain-containing protein [Tanacetum coccineum]
MADAMAAYEANMNSRNRTYQETSGSIRGVVHTTRGCTYKEFMNYQPCNFNGTKGVVGLARLFEKMESVFHISNFGIDVAYEMSWKELIKMMTEVYYPRNEIQKMENELWNLTVKGNDVVGYTQRFQELALLCSGMVPTEDKKIERLKDAIRMAHSLMDQVVRASVAKHAKNKRRWESNQRNNHEQQLNKRKNVAMAYTAGSEENKGYAGNAPLCNKWHYRSEYSKLKNKDHGNQAGNEEARGRAYVLGGEANQDPNIVTGTFLLNNCYASILFDIGADRSFVSTTFSYLIDIIPFALDTKYDVELADGKIIGVNTIIRGCTLNLLNHPFNINLMPVELGSFDVIIGIDWLPVELRIPYGK